MQGMQPTDRTRVRRKPERGCYDPAATYAILDEGLVCHVGFATDGQPFHVPDDVAYRCWAGEIPLRLVAEVPVPAPQLADGIEPTAGPSRYQQGDATRILRSAGQRCQLLLQLRQSPKSLRIPHRVRIDHRLALHRCTRHRALILERQPVRGKQRLAESIRAT